MAVRSLLLVIAAALATGCSSKKPPPLLTSEQASDGTRLRASWLGLDGTWAFRGWLDTVLGTPCRVGTAADGSLRCLPGGPEVAVGFADPGCSEPAVAVPACDAALGLVSVLADPASCAGARTYALGAPLAAIYVGSSASCLPGGPAPGQAAYRLGREVAPAELVAFRLSLGPASGGLAVVRLEGADGSSQFAALHDSAGDFHCFPSAMALSADPAPGPRCLPLFDAVLCDPGAFICSGDAVWGNDTCTDQAVWTGACAPPRFALEVLAGPSFLARIRQVAPGATTPYGDTGIAACGPVPPPRDGYQAHLVGDVVPPAAFVPGQPATAGGLEISIDTVRFPGGVEVRSWIFPVDRARGRSCLPTLAADGLARCLPLGATSNLSGYTFGFGGYGQGLFADPGCTRPLTALAQPEFSTDEASTCPLRARAFRVGPEHQGAIYGGSPCQEITTGYPSPLFLVGEELPPETFPLLDLY